MLDVHVFLLSCLLQSFDTLNNLILRSLKIINPLLWCSVLK